MKQAISSRARLGVILLGVAVLVAAALTATTRAGSIRTSAVITVSPHVLTAPSQGFLTIKFINRGPSTVNHVVAKVGDGNTLASLPLPQSAFDLPAAGCDFVGATTVITCDLGQVPPGTVRRVIRFDALEPAAFTPFVSVAFDEGKNSGLQDTVTDDDFPLSIVSEAQDRTGRCTTDTTTDLALPLTTLGSQATSLTYHPLPLSALGLPCTPASSGVDPLGTQNSPDPVLVPKPFNAISFVDFLDGAGLSTVKVQFLTTPKGITKKNLAVFEMANYPDPLLTKNGSTVVVPKCEMVGPNLQIPPGSPFHSCVVGVDTLAGGGLVATLLAQGGSDPGWGGIG
jgi:hypothetical protein